MNQITQEQELNALETLSVQGLQNIEKVFMANFEKRKGGEEIEGPPPGRAAKKKPGDMPWDEGGGAEP